jgi:nitrogen fixation protein FixH
MPGWLKGLAVTCLLAVAANAVLLWQALHVRRDLVRKDYYEAGLDQDGRMARTALAEAGGMHTDFLRDGDGLRVEAKRDGGFAGAGADPLKLRVCEVQFYRPDDGREDAKLEFIREDAAEGSAVRWRGPSPKLRRGLWRITLFWMDGARPIMEKSLDYFSPG